MVKDGEDQHGLQTENFEIFRLNSSPVSRSKLEMNPCN